MLLGLSGGISMLFGVLLLANPRVGAIAIVILLGGYAFCFGSLMLMFALRMDRSEHYDVRVHVA